MRSPIVPIAVILASIGWGAYTFTDVYAQIRAEQAQTAADDALYQSNKARLTQALIGVSGVTAIDLDKGFWYTYTDQYGNQTVLYYDPNDASRQRDLTDEQIAALRAAVASSTLLSGTVVANVPNDQLPPELQYHNALYASAAGGTSTIAMEQSLKASIKDDPTSEALFELSYLSELKGDYAERDALNAENCAQFHERCADSIAIVLKGRILDAQGDPVEGAKVTVVSRPEIAPVQTDDKGAYSISLKAMPMEKLRVGATKRNYSDGFADTVVLTEDATQHIHQMDDITLEAPIQIVTIDYAKKSVTGIGDTFNADGSVTLVTSRSTYVIPPGAVVTKDGTPYAGSQVDVYLYEFDRTNPPASLTRLDTFDEVRGYAGDVMQSFGMPYIQLFSPSGTELDILRSKPMSLTYAIPDMDALEHPTDGSDPLTAADIQLMVTASAKEPYSIDRSFIIDHELYQFPPFWVFDHRRGVWDNVGISMLNAQGSIRTIFYTINDQL